MAMSLRKTAFILIPYSLLIASLGVYCNIISMPGVFETPEPVEEWFQNINKMEKSHFTIKLNLYIHDMRNSVDDLMDKTVWDVAQADITPTSPTSFGRVQVFDNLVTEGPEYDSPPIGRAQGILAFADLHQTVLYINVNVAFTEGLYNESTISIVGRYPFFGEKAREMSIVGGTGVFRMARGLAVSIGSTIDFTTNNGVYGYALYVTNQMC